MLRKSSRSGLSPQGCAAGPVQEKHSGPRAGDTRADGRERPEATSTACVLPPPSWKTSSAWRWRCKGHVRALVSSPGQRGPTGPVGQTGRACGPGTVLSKPSPEVRSHGSARPDIEVPGLRQPWPHKSPRNSASQPSSGASWKQGSRTLDQDVGSPKTSDEKPVRTRVNTTGPVPQPHLGGPCPCPSRPSAAFPTTRNTDSSPPKKGVMRQRHETSQGELRNPQNEGSKPGRWQKRGPPACIRAWPSLARLLLGIISLKDQGLEPCQGTETKNTVLFGQNPGQGV